MPAPSQTRVPPVLGRVVTLPDARPAARQTGVATATGTALPAASGPAQPASGGWRPGDPPGRRQWFALDAPLLLESGAQLDQVVLAYETWGQLAPDGRNAVLVEHALTADAHVAGPAEPGDATPGWWDGLIGPGRPLDTDRWFIVCANVLGGCQGSTGPSAAAPDGRPYGSRWPQVTLRDGVQAETQLATALGIERWALVIGGSMGGMRALEWAATAPDRVEALLLLACGAASSAEQIAWCGIQLAAITTDPGWQGGDYHDAPAGSGPSRGLGLARRIAHVTYRSEPELDARFGRSAQPGETAPPAGRYAVESYLDHHANKLVHRFDAGSYVALTQMMDGHDVGRGRGGIAAALAAVTAQVQVAGIDSDRLYPLAQQQALAQLLPGRPPVTTVRSVHGHDGFLLEIDQVGELVRAALAAR